MTPATGAYRLDMLSEHATYFGTDGSKYDGVTRVVKVLDKPALLFWAWNLGQQGKTLDDARSGSTDRGKVAHGRIEAFCRDLPFDDTDIAGNLMDESDASLARFKDWWGEQGWELVDAERQVSSDRLRIGGTLDLLLHSRKRKATALVDIKTASGFYVEQRLQVCGYEDLIAEPHRWNESRGRSMSDWTDHGPVPVEEVWIARVGKDEPGDMDAFEMSASERILHRKVFRGMAANHYELKKVLARR